MSTADGYSTPPPLPSGAGTTRRAAVDDIEVVARIWQEGWAEAHLGRVPAPLVAARTPASFVERARERVQDTIVATRDGIVAGFVMTSSDEVDQLYLDRAARGSGLARMLLREAERTIRAGGYERAWLAVATGNVPARRFYARQGWIDAGRFAHRAPVPGGTVDVDCHRFVSPIPGSRS